MDKEYEILNLIDTERDVSQRRISACLGISLGNVNLLLKKMVREGLIKLESIPANRVVYMLTPKGFSEKLTKSYVYIKHHYSVIEQAKRTITEALSPYLQKNFYFILRFHQAELQDITKIAIEEAGFAERIVETLPAGAVQWIMLVDGPIEDGICNDRINGEIINVPELLNGKNPNMEEN